MNLLTNPGFEGSVEGGEWYEHTLGKLVKGWVPFYRIERENDGAPEYGYPEPGDPQWEYRRRTGNKSFGWGCTWHTHDGGSYYIFEQAGLTGKRLRFSVWGYYLVGGAGVENPEHPGLVHDCIGIAKAGHTDVWPNVNGSITWSDSWENVVRGYNTKPTWIQHIVETTATADRVALFLYTRPTWAGIHTSGPVWDDAVLEIMEDSHCRGLPRIDYKRIVNVTLDLEVAREVLEKTWPETITNSYDDAGIGDLGTKIAKLWNIPSGKKQDYTDFFARDYPGTKVEFWYTDGWSEPSGWDDYLLWQGDSRWGDVTFGPGNCTMKNTACYITDLAMAQRIYEINADATPLTVNDALGTAGYAPDCNAKWSAIKDNLGLTISSSTKAQADAHIRNGGVMLIEVLPTNLQHFVLAVEVLGDDDYLVLDPYKNAIAPLKNMYAGWESWRMVTKTGPKPDPDPDPDPGPGPQYPKRDSLIGLHLQTGMEGDVAYVAQMGKGIVKCFSFEDAARMKAVNPEVVTIVRMFTREQHIGGDPAVAASRYIATFHDALVRHHRSTDYIESWNETYSSSDRQANLWAVELDKHFTYQIAGLPIGTRACTVVAAVGNPPEDWLVDLLPAVRAVYETGGAIGYHPYWWCNPAADGLHEMRSWWPYHAGRWQEWDKVFVAHGLYPTYALGEAGVVGSGDGYALNAHAGWKSSHTLKSDWGRYFAQIAQFEYLLKDWNRTHGNRCLGATLFTTGQDYTNWLNFQLRKPEMESLATL